MECAQCDCTVRVNDVVYPPCEHTFDFQCIVKILNSTKKCPKCNLSFDSNNVKFGKDYLKLGTILEEKDAEIVELRKALIECQRKLEIFSTSEQNMRSKLENFKKACKNRVEELLPLCQERNYVEVVRAGTSDEPAERESDGSIAV